MADSSEPLTASGAPAPPAVVMIRHSLGAPGLRLGLGPGLRPVRALRQLQQLFDKQSFWAPGRDLPRLRTMLRGSQAAVSLWQGDRLVGFGRATSDGCLRAVLWDVVVCEELKGQGVGRRLVEALLASPAVAAAEKTYLMTTHGEGFYQRVGFSRADPQVLMLRTQERPESG